MSNTFSLFSMGSSLIVADCIVGCCCCCNNERVLSSELSLNPLRPLAKFNPPEGTIEGNIDDDVRVGTDRDGTERDGEDEIAVIDGEEVIASFPVVMIDRFSTSVRSKLG